MMLPTFSLVHALQIKDKNDLNKIWNQAIHINIKIFLNMYKVYLFEFSIVCSCFFLLTLFVKRRPRKKVKTLKIKLFSFLIE